MKKINKEQLEVAQELSMVVALMSCEGRMDRLYKIIHEEGDFGGICDTAYTIAWFAAEFVELHLDTDWQDVFDVDNSDEVADKFLHRSNKYKEFGKYVSCWDEAVEDYAEWRIDNFNYEEFEKINCNRHKKNPMLSDEFDSGGIEIGDEVEIMCINDFQGMKYNIGSTFKVRAIADVGSDNSLYVSEDLVTWFHPIDLKRL